MGAFSSVDLRPEEVREIEDATSFAPKEIKSLYRRFQRLDRSGRGTISTEDLSMIPELTMNPLASLLLSSSSGVFERDAEDRINFRSFVAGLSVFSGRARPEVRQRVVFRLYDVDGDGYVSAEDLRAVLKMMVGKSMSSEAMEAVLARTLADCDVDGDGRISFDDFVAATNAIAWDQFTVAVSSFHRWEQSLSTSNMHSTASFTKLPGAAGGGH